MAQQFESGQLVHLYRSIRSGAGAGVYRIVRQLPDEGGERRYRVKSMHEPHERVVKESEIRHAPQLNINQDNESFSSLFSVV